MEPLQESQKPRNDVADAKKLTKYVTFVPKTPVKSISV